MHSLLLILSTLFFVLLSTAIESPSCGCVNGGTCGSPKAQPRCQCPGGFLGEHCQLPAREISSEEAGVALHSNYTYFYFLPKEVNYYKLTFSICMGANPSKKNTLFYIETERNDGSLREVPSLFETAKIVLEEQTCTSFSTHYISIKRKEDQTFRKIVVGLKIMEIEEQDRYLNIYSNLKEKLRSQDVPISIEEGEQTQHITIKMAYQVYLRTSYYGTFVILFTALALLLILTSLVTLLKKKYTIDPAEVPSLRLPSVDLHYLARAAYRSRRRTYHNNPQQDYRFGSKLSLSNLELFMPVAHYQNSQRMEEEGEREACSICLLEFGVGDETRVTPCSHRYHRQCIDSWWQGNMSCPICRRRLDFRLEMREFYHDYMRGRLIRE